MLVEVLNYVNQENITFSRQFPSSSYNKYNASKLLECDGSDVCST